MSHPVTGRERTDAELLAADFRIITSLDGWTLLDVAPKDVAMGRIVAEYHLKEWRHCAKPNCRTRHKWGYVVELVNGLLIGIGNECGQSIFQNWADYIGTHRRERERRELLIARRSFLHNYDAGIRVLFAWRGPMKEAMAFRHAWWNADRSTFDALSAAAQHHGGELSVLRFLSGESRQMIKEIERDIGRRGRSSASDHTFQVVHRLQGTRFFSQPAPRPALEALIRQFLEIKLVLVNDGIDTSTLRRQMRLVRDAVMRAKDLARTHNAVFEAIAPDNLAGIAKWANESLRSGVKIEPGVLLITSIRATRPVRVPVPPSITQIVESAADIFTAEVDQESAVA